MSYRLPSLHLGTRFDRSVDRLPLPGVAARGDSPAMVILDGASRAPHRLARVARPAALLGLQVEHSAGPLLVGVTLLIDDLSTAMWGRARHLDDPDPATEDGHHRVVRVSLQGRTRAAVILARRSPEEVSVQRLAFRLDPEELGRVGLLTLSLDLPGDPPPWLQRGLLPDGLVGVCIGRVSTRPLDTELRAHVSTGRAPVRRQRLVPRRPGGLVVNPGESRAGTRLLLTPRALARRPRPVGRRATVTEPGARLRDATLRAGQRLVPERIRVEVQPVDGGPGWTEHVDPTPDGRYELLLPAEALPAFVRPVTTRPLGGDWWACCRPG